MTSEKTFFRIYISSYEFLLSFPRKAAKDPAKTRDFALLLSEVKQRIQRAQTQAVLTVNSELVRLYWDIGRIIDARQKHEGWG